MWDTVLVVVLFVACYGCCVWTGFNLGIKYERFRHDKEVDAYVIPEDRLSDSDYWKMQYEALVEDWDQETAMKVLEETDAPGETTE